MMVLSAQRPDASLIEFLAYRARSAPVGRLVAEEAGALTVLGAALRWDPPAQLPIVSAMICLGCYAAWGLIDRAGAVAAARGWTRSSKALRALTFAFTALGLVAGAGILLSVWAFALGTWIS
jgi:hypothetical protein